MSYEDKIMQQADQLLEPGERVLAAIEVKRLLVGKVVHVTVGGVSIKLEAGAGADARGLADAFARVTAAV